MHAKDRASEARAKHAEVGVGFASPTQPSLPFCPGVQFSRDSIRAFNDQIKIRDIAGCEQSNVYITKITLYSGSKDMNFMDSWQKPIHQPFSALARSCHWKIKFVSSRHRATSFIFLNKFVQDIFLPINKYFIWLNPVRPTDNASDSLFHLFWKHHKFEFNYASFIEKPYEL